MDCISSAPGEVCDGGAVFSTARREAIVYVWVDGLNQVDGVERTIVSSGLEEEVVGEIERCSFTRCCLSVCLSFLSGVASAVFLGWGFLVIPVRPCTAKSLGDTVWLQIWVSMLSHGKRSLAATARIYRVCLCKCVCMCVCSRRAEGSDASRCLL